MGLLQKLPQIPLQILALATGALSLSGCLATDASSYRVEYSDLPPWNYSGALFSSGPTLAAYKLGNSDTYKLIQDQASLSAYTDSTCTTAATGSFTIAASSKSFSSGTASYSNVSYTWPVANMEGSLYFLGITRKMGLWICSSAVGITRHFNTGVGGKAFGTTTVLGTTGVSPGDGATAVLQDSSGRYVLAGYTTSASNRNSMAAWRYYPSGTPDTTYGVLTTGAATQGTTGLAGGSGANLTDTGQTGLLDTSDRLLIAGTTRSAGGDQRLAIWRYNADGTPDTGWGASGGRMGGAASSLAGQTSPNISEAAYSMALDATGRYVLGGISNTAAGGVEYAFWRFDPVTGIDTTLGGGAGGEHWGASPAGGTGTCQRDMAVAGTKVTSDGKILLVGYGQTGAACGSCTTATSWPCSRTLTMVRYNADGSKDTTFGTSGAVTFGTNGASGTSGATQDDVAFGSALDSQGRIVISGYSRTSTGGYRLVIWRYTSAGVLDTSFANGVGFAIAANPGIAGGTRDRGAALAIDSSGRYVVAGYSANAVNGWQLAVWRYNSDGSPDSTWGTNGAKTYSATGLAGATGASETEYPTSLLIDRYGRYVITGYSVDTGGMRQQAIWRVLQTTGELDL